MSDILDLDKVFGPDPEDGRLIQREPGRLPWQDAFDPNNGRSSDYLPIPSADDLYADALIPKIVDEPSKGNSATTNGSEGVWEQVRVIHDKK